MTLKLLDFFLSAGTTLTETCLLYLLMTFFFPKRDIQKFSFYFVFIFSWLLQLAKHFFYARYSAWLPLYSIAVDFIAVNLCFRGRLRIKTIFLFLIYGVIVCCEALVFSFIVTITSGQIIGLHSQDERELIVFVLSKALQSLAVIAMTRLGWSKQKLVIKRELLVFFLIIPVCGAIGIYVLYPIVWFEASFAMLMILMLFSIFILVFILLLFHFIVIQTKAEDQIETARIYDRNAHDYFTKINLMTRNVHKHLHDSRYNLIHLYSLLDQQEIDKAKEYIDTLNQSLTSQIPMKGTGNAQIDSLLQYYSGIFLNNSVDLEVSGRLPPDLSILPQDMARLLGNALDNALEACKCGAASSRTVKVEFAYDNNYLSIRVKNPYDSPPVRKGDRLFSSKLDVHKHGYGMAIMEELAQKYDGGIFYDASDREFILRIILNEKKIKTGT